MKQLFSPDFFRDDWYGYLTNQISHVSIGVLFTWGLCLACFLIMGELPYKFQIFTTLAGMYFLYELLFQGWQGVDTVEDWTFFSVYGVLGTVLSFNEFNIGSGLVTLSLVSPTTMFTLLTVHLLIGCLLRKFNKIPDD